MGFGFGFGIFNDNEENQSKQNRDIVIDQIKSDLHLVPVFAQLSCWRIFCEHGGLEVQ